MVTWAKLGIYLIYHIDFVLASGYSLMMPFMTISSNKDSVVLSGVKSLSFLPFFPFCLLFFPFFLFLLIFPFLPLSRSTAFNQIYNKFLGTKEIFFLISDKTILLSHLTLSHSFNLSFTHSRHAEQVLFSCLASKVTVYCRKLQCFLWDINIHIIP